MSETRFYHFYNFNNLLKDASIEITFFPIGLITNYKSIYNSDINRHLILIINNLILEIIQIKIL